jgi:hypothetical protein
MVEMHEAHDRAAMSGWGTVSGAAARLVCLTCDVVVMPLPVCGKKTKKGNPCRAAIRVDQGKTTCRNHG